MVASAIGARCGGSKGRRIALRANSFLLIENGETQGLRQVIVACRKGGRISIPGVYGGVTDKFPIGALMEKGLSVKSGQTHVQKYMPDLLKLIREGKLDTTFLISHRLGLEQASEGYKIFKEQQNEVAKVVLNPH